MTTTTTWQINTLERELATGFVSKAIFRVVGTDGTYTYRVVGEVKLDEPEVLVPYSDLTEETVLGWVKDKLDEVTPGTVSSLEAAVVNGVNEQSAPTTGKGTPWE